VRADRSELALKDKGAPLVSARGLVTAWPRQKTRAPKNTLEPGRSWSGGAPNWNSPYMPRVGMLISNTYKEVIMAKRATKKAAPKKSAAKRELIAPRGAKRYIRRAAAGRIKESDDVSRSLSQDRRRKAKTAAKPGQGDRGDRKSASKRKKSSAMR
jgi:hypothetical protein